jgi:ABC-type sulfate transport system permease subunit
MIHQETFEYEVEACICLSILPSRGWKFWPRHTIIKFDLEVIDGFVHVIVRTIYEFGAIPTIRSNLAIAWSTMLHVDDIAASHAAQHSIMADPF